MQSERFDPEATWSERFGSMPSAGESLCKYCDKVVDQNQPHFRRASGWEKVRAAGEGVRPLVMREVSGEYAHSWCVDAAKHGSTDAFATKPATLL